MGDSLYKLLDRKMASVEASKLSKDDHDELACSYAALMLHDDGCEITAERLAQVITASGNSVEPYWPVLFAKALKTAKIDDLLSNVVQMGGGGGGAAVAAPMKELQLLRKKRRKKSKMSIWEVFSETMTSTEISRRVYKNQPGSFQRFWTSNISVSLKRVEFAT